VTCGFVREKERERERRRRGALSFDEGGTQKRSMRKQERESEETTT